MQLHQLEQVPQNGVSFLSSVLASCEILDMDICRLVFKEKFPLKVAFEHRSLKEIRVARKSIYNS